IWRSQIFNKEPGQGELKRHQARLFTGREYGRNRPSLTLPTWAQDYSDWFNVTTWIAVDETTVDNGAVQIARGSGRKRYEAVQTTFADSVFGAVVNGYFEAAHDEKRLEELRNLPGIKFLFDPVAAG